MYDIFDMQQRDYSGIEDLTDFDPSMITRDDADQHFAAVDQDGRISARCSIWWRGTPIVDDQHTGAIGHYAANDAGSASILLEHACPYHIKQKDLPS